MTPNLVLRPNESSKRSGVEMAVSSKQSVACRIEGAGPLLIYVPGLDGTGELFFKQSPKLTHSHRVVTFRSREVGQFTYDDLTRDVADLIEDLGESHATVVGESFGGTVALSFALRYPNLLKRLVVINSFPRFRRRNTIRFGSRLARSVPFNLLWPLRRSASSVGLMIDGVAREDRKLFWKAIRTVNSHAYQRRLQLIEQFDIEPQLSEIETPTLFVAGSRDLLVPSVSEARLMASKMPNAKVAVINGAGHACLLGGKVNLDQLLKANNS